MSAPLQPGSCIDGFTVLQALGTGGSARLYRVSHPEHGSGLLMKTPRLGPDEPAFGVVSFETECTLLPALRGPHVPRFVASGPFSPQPYLVMEMIRGRDLKSHIRPGGLPLAELAELGFAMATAAHSLHRQDAIHLDIKPDNILLREDGDAVLIDYGFAHHARYPDLFQEESRLAVGSTPYMAPEQAVGVRDEPRSDQFALGVTLYQLATGRLPFGVPATLAEVRARAWTRPTPLRALRQDLPPWFQEIVFTCLEPEPERRYASCALVAQALSHPDSVALTERATRLEKDGWLERLWRSWRQEPDGAGKRRAKPLSPSEQAQVAPLFLVAFDPYEPDEALLRALRYAVVRVLQRDPESRLACVALLEDAAEGGGASASERQHACRIALHHWARQLEVPEERLSLHVFESVDPAQRLLDYARRNSVDALIIPAPRDVSPAFRFNRSFLTRVVEQAPCSVHVVRPPQS
ncbi:MAG: protein kinase [Betaproteobacteria bacterium]|nr:protein kinase [Betaproteobacteria bacterium]